MTLASGNRTSRRVAIVVLVSLALPLLAFATPEPAVAARTFGDQPLDDVLYWAQQERRCGLTRNKLAALMLAPTWPETGAPLAEAPSPMTLSRWDDRRSLYSFGTRVGDRKAFWHPGVGAWQLDSAGLGARYSAAQRINTYVAAARTASTIASRWCIRPRLDYVWAPWYGCEDGVCRRIYDAIYRRATDRLVSVVRDSAVESRGGSERRVCQGLSPAVTFTCWRVDPALAQGYAGFAEPSWGRSPVTAPFYVYVADGREYRHWLRRDTGYARGVWATRPIGSDARTSLTWHYGEPVADVTPPP